MAAHAMRQPCARTAPPTIGNAAMKPTLNSTEYIPIARLKRRLNHWPTMVRLTTESAL